MKRGGENKSVQRVYFALAAFNVGTLLVSLWLGHQLMDVYQASVAENEQWAKRLAGYAHIGQLVTQANGPGNDVFVDKDVAGQRKNLETLRTAALSEFEAANADLAQLPEAQRGELAKDLAQARTEFGTLTGEAADIFRDFEAGKLHSAGEHMGQMDQAFARSSAALDELRSQVQAIQSSLFAAQLQTAAKSQSSQYLLMGFVVLMVIAVVSYGFRLQATLRAQQDALDRAAAGMRLVLDNVDQGLITVDSKGAVVGERSDATTRWLGSVSPNQAVWDLIGKVDPRAASWLETGWGDLAEGLMPLDVVIDQLPRRMTAGKRELEVSYRPIHQGSELKSVLVMFSDVTARVAAERTEAEQRQTLAMFERVMKDRERFVGTFSELRELLGRLRAGTDAVTGKRLIHTLKGNSASIGLGVFSSLCHAIEDELIDDAGPSKGQLDRLQAAFDGLEKWLETMTRDRAQSLVIGAEEYDAMVRAVNDDRHDLSAVRGIVSALQKEPVSRRLEQFADEAQTLAQRLGKGPVQVLVDGGGVRVEKERFGAFFGSLVHVIRNAIDHGFETPDVRAARSKSTPVLRLAAKVSGQEFHLTVADDGEGIDFDTLLERSRSRGFEAPGVEAVFLDGVSTKDEVSSTSGRGIGMSAVKAETERLGGRVAVHSVRGEGSTFTFSFPVTGVSVLAPQASLEQRAAS